MRFRSTTFAVFALSLTLPTVATGATAAQAQSTPPTQVVAGSIATTVAQVATAARGVAEKGSSRQRGVAAGRVRAAGATNPKIAETCGVKATLTLDASGSIGQAGATQQVINGAKGLIDALIDTNSSLRITKFSTASSEISPRTDVTKVNAGTLRNQVASKYKSDGWTNWQGALQDGGSDKPKLLIFMTDGDPTTWNGGTTGTSASHIQRSYEKALPAADAVKNAGTRILVVGVGKGLTSKASRDRMYGISGQFGSLYTDPDALETASINEVSTVAFENFDALDDFLRDVVTSLCGSSVTVQKLAQTSADSDYVPQPGWNVSVRPNTTGGWTWVEPTGADNSTQPQFTAGAQGNATFQWKPMTAGSSSNVQISETVQSSYTARRWECDIKKPDGQVFTEGGTFGGAASFTIPVPLAARDVAACRLYNGFNYAPGISITKTAADDPVRGNADGWNEAYTFVVRNTGNAALRVATPVDTKCEDITGPTGPGSGTGQLQPGVEWTYECTRHIQHPTVTEPIEAPNTVTVVGIPPEGDPVDAQATETVDVKTPDIEVIKTAEKTESGDPIPDGGSVPAGTSVTYIYTVNNIGNDVLEDITINDDKCSPVTRTIGAGDTLAVGDTWEYRCVKVINPPSGQATVDNTVTVSSHWSGYTPSGQNNGAITDTDTFEIQVDRSASLTIIKSTNPAAFDQDFDFTMSGQGVPSGDAAFTLNASDEPSTPPASRTVELDGPSGGGSVYTVTEAEVTGWVATGANCIDQDGTPVTSNFDSGTRTITPTVVPEQDVTCTFVNERLPRLQVTKQTSPHGATQTFDFDVTDPNPVTGGEFTLGDGETETLDNLPVSDYDIAETVPAGWELDDVDCGGKSFSRVGDVISLELGYGDDVECVFSNGKIPPATLTIVKQGNPLSSPDFDFNASGTGLVDPGQPGSDDFTLAVGESKSYEVRPAAGGNTYTVTEGAAPTPPAGESGWVLTDIECVVNGDTANPIAGDTGTGIVEVPLDPTDTAVCTYTNKQLPRLSIVKNAVDPGEPTDDTEFTFTSTGLTPADPFVLKNSANTETFTDLTVGASFDVTETPVANWTLTSLECTGDGSGAISTDVNAGQLSSTGLTYGDDVVCTFVNTKEPAQAYLIIMKGTDPAGSTQEFDFTATGFDLDDSFSLTDGALQGFEVDPGFGGQTYTVTESPLSGWDLIELDCVVSSDPSTVIPGNLGTGSVDVELLQGEVAVCVFENQQRGTLTVTKMTDQDTATEFDFTASSDPAGIAPASFSLARGASETFTNLAANTEVTITETIPTDAPDRWDLSTITCQGFSGTEEIDVTTGEAVVTVGAGGDVECIYTNMKVPEATVQIVKSADPADGTTFDFTATGANGGVVPDAGDECDPPVAGQACFSLAPDGGPAVKDLTVYPAAGGETFTFAEGTLPDDWNLDDITCLDNGSPAGTPDVPAGTIDVTINPGDTVVCTFTNREDATLTVIKSATDDPAQSFDFDWTPLTPNTFSLTDGQSQTATGLEPGSVTLSEVDLPADWYLTGQQGEHPDCVGAATVDYTPTNGVTIDVAAGEDITCTFTNVFDYRPSIQLDKVASRSVVVKGETVDYTYTLTNTGNTTVTPVAALNDVIVDDKCAPVTYVSGGTPPNMAPGDVWTFECTGYQVDEDTLNTATATMKDPLDVEVTSTDTEFVEELSPAMQLTKLVDKTVVYPGTEVTYTYELMNTGKTDLQNQVSPSDRDAWVTDDQCSPVTYVSGDGGTADILEVGETWLYECTTTIDVTTTNVATATATPLDPDGGVPVGEPLIETAEQLVEVIQGDITVTKTATAPGGVMAGDVLMVPVGSEVTYTYDVTSGTATVGMEVLSVADDKCSPVTYSSGDTNENGLVDPGETWKYECIQTFESAGLVTNTVAVTAVEPTLGGVSVATDQADVEGFLGSISLTKAPDRDLVPTGSSVTYTYRATNTGTTDLSEIVLSDDKCTPLVYVSGDDGDGVMKPGDVWSYTCSTSLTRTTTNVAVVTGKTPIGGIVNATDSAQVVVFNPANLDAKIKVKKSASKTKVTKGTKVKYTYKVSNPGKLALAKVKQNMTDNKCRPVKYIRGDKDKNGLLTSGKESGGEFPREVWTFTCKSKIKKTTVNTVTAKGKGWLNGQIVGPTVKDKAKAKVRVIGSGGNNSGGKCKHHGLGWATAAQLEPWAAPTQPSIKCRKGKG